MYNRGDRYVLNQKYKFIIAIIGFIIITILGYFILPKGEIVENINNAPKNDVIFVHIEGEVNNPGLIEVDFGIRLYELIEKAGRSN